MRNIGKVIDTQTGVVFTTGEKKDFDVAATHTHIKLDVTKANGAVEFDIHELDLSDIT